MVRADVPTFDALMNPVVQALRSLGGSGTIEEINTRVAEIAGLSDEQLEVLHDPERGGQTEFEYRVAWTRTYLKKYGVLENSDRGVWALTAKGAQLDRVDPKVVRREVQGQRKKAPSVSEDVEIEETGAGTRWQDELMKSLLKMEPAAFERLVQRLLREAGFIQVEVTGRSGDGGVDGKGIMRLGGMLSFRVIFQRKRYQGSITPSQIRDFRGAMVGRADKGLFITTGNFTKEAMREAMRDGAPAIDLIDGDQLVEKLREFELGVRTERIEVERVTVDHGWFSST